MGACAPSTPALRAPEGAQPSDARRPSAVEPKTLQVAFLVEPNEGLALRFGGNTQSYDYPFLFHSSLTVWDENSVLQPRLAEEVPSIERGTWQVNSDGSMVVTWRLRDNLRWQDGTPLTADDFVFGMDVLRDESLSVNKPTQLKLIRSVEAVDSKSFRVVWIEPYIQANVGATTDLPAVPRHLLGAQYEADRSSLNNSLYWSREFVGLGPYRLTGWIEGSHMEGAAFDGYVHGRPKIDGLRVKFLGDQNTLVANILTGEVEIAMSGIIRIAQALAIKEQWDGMGVNGTLVPVPTKIRYTEFQYRDPAAPFARDVRVRQALTHAMDRQTLVDTLLYGLTRVAHTYLLPESGAYQVADRNGLAKYPYDPRRAEQLFAEAGLSRGTDGLLRQANGERFNLEVRTTGGEQQNVQEAQAVADNWKAAGVNTEMFVIPTARINDREFRASFPGVSQSATGISATWLEIWTSRSIPSASNQWRGNNRGGHSDPQVDELYERYLKTIDESPRYQVHADLVRHMAERVSYIPTYYQIDVLGHRTGLRGPGPNSPEQLGTTWNVHAWTKE